MKARFLSQNFLAEALFLAIAADSATQGGKIVRRGHAGQSLRETAISTHCQCVFGHNGAA